MNVMAVIAVTELCAQRERFSSVYFDYIHTPTWSYAIAIFPNKDQNNDAEGCQCIGYV